MKKMILIVLFIFGVLLGGYMLLIEPFQIKIVEREVVTNKWQDEKPLRIALIADTHAIWPWMTPNHINRIIDKANAQKPDIILMLGDYVMTQPVGIKPKAAESLKLYERLNAPCGVFSITGNHDVRKDMEWLNALRSIKIPLLENEAVEVKCEGKNFWIAGLEEIRLQNADIDKTLADVTNDRPVIMMVHNPDAFAEMPKEIALTVAGHTHAGQVRFPFLGSVELVIPSKFGKRYEYGHIQEDGKDLVVSGGLGTTGLPIRLLNPPEIVIVTLRSGK